MESGQEFSISLRSSESDSDSGADAGLQVTLRQRAKDPRFLKKAGGTLLELELKL